jgi:2-polyprenyl-3-methyl-5-hydroxy-6-metoxy-1,4-benzoquinol methylase
MTEILVNQYHSRQDIFGNREYDPARTRYRFAFGLLQELATRLEDSPSLVDIGGGAGEFCELARHLRFQTTLVDGNDDSVRRELKRGYRAIHQDLTMGLQTIVCDSYDVAVCLEVIEHIVNCEHLLNEIYRALRPGGFLILSTPNFGYILDRLTYLRGGLAREEGYHFRFFTRSHLRKIVEDVGFVMDGTASIASPLGVNAVLRRLTFGKIRLRHFECPTMLESWFSSTFVWRLQKPLNSQTGSVS